MTRRNPPQHIPQYGTSLPALHPRQVLEVDVAGPTRIQGMHPLGLAGLVDEPAAGVVPGESATAITLATRGPRMSRQLLTVPLRSRGRLRDRKWHGAFFSMRFAKRHISDFIYDILAVADDTDRDHVWVSGSARLPVVRSGIARESMFEP